MNWSYIFIRTLHQALSAVETQNVVGTGGLSVIRCKWKKKPAWLGLDELVSITLLIE
jgi:hypothetical protein